MKNTYIAADTNGTEIADDSGNITVVPALIEVPVEAFPEFEFSFVFNHYVTSVFFPLSRPDNVNESDYDVVTDTEVIGFTIPEEPNITNLSMPVRIILQSMRGRRGEVIMIKLHHYYFTTMCVCLYL